MNYANQSPARFTPSADRIVSLVWGTVKLATTIALVYVGWSIFTAIETLNAGVN